VKQLGSFNILWAAFHEWIGIAQDVWAAPRGAKLGYIIMPPGWSHDGSRETSESLKARWAEVQEAKLALSTEQDGEQVEAEQPPAPDDDQSGGQISSAPSANLA
jgi:hypothetical protein